VSCLQGRDDFAIVLDARPAATFNDQGFNPQLSGFDQPAGFGLVADYDRDLGVWDPAVTGSFCQREHVRSTAGNQNSYASSLIYSRFLRHD
jgi:hypothetical protein